MKKIIIISCILSLYGCSKQSNSTEYSPLPVTNSERIEVYVLLQNNKFNPQNLLETDMLQTIKIYGELSEKEIPFTLSENNRYLKFVPEVPDYRSLKNFEIDATNGWKHYYTNAKTNLFIKGQKIVLDCEFKYSVVLPVDGSPTPYVNASIQIITIKIDNGVITKEADSMTKMIIPLVYEDGKISVK